MWPLVRQARYLGRYREIAQILGSHGFGYLVEQLGLITLLSLPRRAILRVPPPPPVGTAVRLREALIALGPTFVKLGQVLSTRPDLLPPEFVIELDKLQDTVPPFPADVAIATIEEELGQPIGVLFSTFDPVPIAAASLGQVHAATLPTGEDVVVKVQRPDITTRVNTDLAIIADLAGLAQERLSLGRRYDLIELANEFSVTLRGELDYNREGRNAERFRGNFEGSPIVQIPHIYWERSSEHVITMERFRGVKINDTVALAKNAIDREVLARNCVKLILQEIFTYGFFHGDPHPGNFFALPGGTIGAIDFGQVVSLDQETTHGLLLLLGALVNHNTNDVLRALQRLDLIDQRAVTPALRRDMQRFTTRFVDMPLADLSARETLDELLALLRRHHIRLNGPLAQLLKSIIMMEGVGLQLDPSLDVFGIARPYVQQALVAQFSPSAISERLLERGREAGETISALPQQLSNVLQRLDDGEIHIQLQEQEMRRLAGAMIGTANRLALALIVAATIISIGMVTIAIGVGGWSGTVPTVILVVGLVVIAVGSLALGLALLRGRE